MSEPEWPAVSDSGPADRPGVSDPGPADRPGVSDPGRGRRIGVDVGSVRIGVAACDPDGILATPVETVPRSKSRADKSDLARLAAIVEEYDAVEVIVGLPQTLRGERGTAAGLATSFAAQLRDRLEPVPVRMTDERFTTVTASRALRESGVKAKGQRSVIDQAAAVAILQGWLDQRSRVLSNQRDPHSETGDGQ